ncbi:transmembrane protein 53-B-like [Pelodiscus sinensis]|uniref:transmembrane protein 53-B-like n=1 Tax=Pelodiscus sinensis TaxID=13735 RepID=UPI003F6A612A
MLEAARDGDPLVPGSSPPSWAMQPAGTAERSGAPGRAAAVTVFSKTIRLHRSPPGSALAAGAPCRPLVLLLPWFGARPRALARYLELYLPRGLDVLVVESELSHFLWPRWGLAYAARVLRLLQDSPPCRARPLLVHAVSIGGYTFAQMLVHLSHEPQRHGLLAQRIRGLVYDSLVTGGLADMALGVAQMTVSTAWRPLLAGGTKLYFCLLRCCTVRYYAAAQRVFLRPPLRCPVLLFHGGEDPLSPPGALQALLAGWRGAGLRVQAHSWPDSRHAAHLRQHPREYQAALQGFLNQLGLAPLQARL